MIPVILNFITFLQSYNKVSRHLVISLLIAEHMQIDMLYIDSNDRNYHFLTRYFTFLSGGSKSGLLLPMQSTMSLKMKLTMILTSPQSRLPPTPKLVLGQVLQIPQTLL